MTRLAIVVLLAAACGRDKQPPAPQQQATGSGSADPGMELPRPAFAIEQVGVPDHEGWRSAVTSAARAWAESFNKIGVTKAKIAPVTAPDGTIAPYLLQVVAEKHGEPAFKGVALISKGLLINGGGKARLEQHLAWIGFPARGRLGAGHLIEMLHATGAVDKAWLQPPSVVGWELARQPNPPTLTYDDKGALLTLYRGGSDAPLERLEIRFDSSGFITTAAARNTGETWEPIAG